MRILRIICWLSRTGHAWTFGPPEVVPYPDIPFEYTYCMRCLKRKD